MKNNKDLFESRVIVDVFIYYEKIVVKPSYHSYPYYIVVTLYVEKSNYLYIVRTQLVCGRRDITQSINCINTAQHNTTSDS